MSDTDVWLPWLPGRSERATEHKSLELRNVTVLEPMFPGAHPAPDGSVPRCSCAPKSVLVVHVARRDTLEPLAEAHQKKLLVVPALAEGQCFFQLQKHTPKLHTITAWPDHTQRTPATYFKDLAQCALTREACDAASRVRLFSLPAANVTMSCHPMRLSIHHSRQQTHQTRTERQSASYVAACCLSNQRCQSLA